MFVTGGRREFCSTNLHSFTLQMSVNANRIYSPLQVLPTTPVNCMRTRIRKLTSHLKTTGWLNIRTGLPYWIYHWTSPGQLSVVSAPSALTTLSARKELMHSRSSLPEGAPLRLLPCLQPSRSCCGKDLAKPIWYLVFLRRHNRPQVILN